MTLADPFTKKLLERIDKIDRDQLEDYLRKLSHTALFYRELLQEIQEGVLLLDEKSRLLWMNKRAAEWLGFSWRGEPLPKWADEIKDAGLAKLCKSGALRTSARKVFEAPILSPVEKYLRLTVLPLEEEDQLRTAVFIEDMTRQRAEEGERERLQRFESLAHLTAGIAHEIGNPLNAISIHLQLARKNAQTMPDPQHKKLTEHLDVMATEIKRLDGVIKNFLKATRKPPLRFKLENLNQLAEEAIRVMAPEAAQMKVQIDFKKGPNLPDFLLDRERFYPVFLNLIKNAIDAMPKGGKLKVALSHRDKLAAVRFEDSGVGIPESDLPHIFEAFYTTKANGTGLGLMSVYESVAEHGGRIDVSSKAGKGTVFTLYLPIRLPKLQLTKLPNP